MGGDGGSIPGRADIVRTKGYKFIRNLGGMGYTPNTMIRADNERMHILQERKLRVTTCRLTQDPLRQPIVVDKHGVLFNKEELVRRLLAKQDTCGVRRLKDVQEVAAGCFNAETGRLMCPVSKSDVTASVRAVVVWKCGCVVRQPMFSELQRLQAGCPNCAGKVEAVTEIAPKDWTEGDLARDEPPKKRQRVDIKPTPHETTDNAPALEEVP